MRFGIAGWIATAALAAGALALSAAPASAGCTLAKYGELPVTMDGLQPIVHAKINGEDEEFLVNTGGFYSFLTPRVAKKLQLPSTPAPEGFFVSGSGGFAEVSFVKAKQFDVAGIKAHDVEFMVRKEASEFATRGLLGQNLLRQTDVEFDLANGVIRLFAPQGCGAAPLAYWAKTQGVSTVRLSPTTDIDTALLAHATLNGAPIKVEFVTGSSQSMITLQAAARLGVRPGGDGVVPSGVLQGARGRSGQSWIAPFASFKLGDEEIQHAKLRIADIDLADTDMVIGVDFFLSHRIYVSNAQNRLYFTYNGGHVFDLSPPKPEPQPVGAAGATSAATAGTDEPSDPRATGAEPPRSPREATTRARSPTSTARSRSRPATPRASTTEPLSMFATSSSRSPWPT